MIVTFVNMWLCVHECGLGTVGRVIWAIWQQYLQPCRDHLHHCVLWWQFY